MASSSSSSPSSPVSTNENANTPSTICIYAGPHGSISLNLTNDSTSISTNSVVIGIESHIASSSGPSDENPFAADWATHDASSVQQQAHDDQGDEAHKLLRALKHLESFLESHYCRMEPQAALRDALLASGDRLIRELSEGREDQQTKRRRDV
ncbi:hypothetical protein BC567DRAFT_206818 [Phyllosticta citribraziliensis]